MYYHNSGIQGIVELKKYNILTKQSTLITTFNQKVAGQPKWGANGWIAFTSLQGGYVEHIYIVKDNGDSLRQFTHTTYNSYPAWGNNNDLYYQHSPVLGAPCYLLKQNLQNNTLDTLSKTGDNFGGVSVFNDINSHNKLISQTLINNLPSIAIANLNIVPLNFEHAFDSYNHLIERLAGLCWSNSNQYVFFTIYLDGLYRLNTFTKKQEKLIQFCDSKRYEAISCSSDGRYLLAERVDSIEQGDNILEKRKIYLIDLHTRTQTELVLD